MLHSFENSSVTRLFLQVRRPDVSVIIVTQQSCNSNITKRHLAVTSRVTSVRKHAFCYFSTVKQTTNTFLWRRVTLNHSAHAIRRQQSQNSADSETEYAANAREMPVPTEPRWKPTRQTVDDDDVQQRATTTRRKSARNVRGAAANGWLPLCWRAWRRTKSMR